jgi:MarR family transcriptional regulator, organic hydroperoxide resistance regulator
MGCAMSDQPMPAPGAGRTRLPAGHAASPPPAAPPSVSGGDSATEVVRLLSIVNRRMQRLVETGRAEAELPSMAWQLMHTIDRHAGITLGELARASELSKGRTSVLVDGLVRLGYVSKSDDASDGRLTRLCTTERMAEVWEWYEGRYAAVVNELMSDLDDWERAALVGILRRLRTSAESRGWQP